LIAAFLIQLVIRGRRPKSYADGQSPAG